MTGWNSDPDTLNLVDTVVSTIMSRPDLLPDTWYHVELHMGMKIDEIERTTGKFFDQKTLDHEMVEWYKSDPDRLKERIAWIKRIQLAHFESIEILTQELERLE